MAAAKLQYSDRMVHSMRASFVQLLDSNRQSFRGQMATKGNDQFHTTFDNLKKTAMALTTQKVEAPAPHEKIVVGGEKNVWYLTHFTQSPPYTLSTRLIFDAVVLVWMIAISILSFLKLDVEQWKLYIGIMANINTFFFYGAPLTTIVSVLKTRDSRYHMSLFVVE